MKCFIWRFLLILMIAMPAFAQAPNSALSSWLNAQTNMHTWSADFVQTRSLKTLTQPLVESGRIYFSQPNRFRWELGHPPKTIAVRSPGGMLLLYPRLKRAERIQTDAAATGPWKEAMSLVEAGFPRSQAEMESKFNILSQVVTNDVINLILQPKSTTVRKMMPQVEIAFDLKQKALRSMELQFADGSSLRNDFTNPVLNPHLDESLFAPPIPSDYKISEPLKQ